MEVDDVLLNVIRANSPKCTNPQIWGIFNTCANSVYQAAFLLCTVCSVAWVYERGYNKTSAE